jgi:hypothetical protein
MKYEIIWGTRPVGIPRVRLLCVVALLGTLFVAAGVARADGILAGTVQITSGDAASIAFLTNGFNLSGDGLYLHSATNDFVPHNTSWQLVPEGNQSFLLILTILANPGITGSISIPPCGGGGPSGSSGTFEGSVNADCLVGSITFTSILTAPCLAGGIYSCPQTTPLQSGPFIASGEFTGWTAPCPYCAATEIFDVRVFGQGVANLTANANIGVNADYTFTTTPEPSSLLLLGTGLSAIGFLTLRRKAQSRAGSWG